MFKQLREVGRKFQVKYENFIATKSLYGFSNAYAEAMKQIKQKNHREAA